MTQEESNKIRELYEIYEQPMYRIAFAVLKNPAYAEDAVSEAFMRIIKKIDKIGEPDSPKTKSFIVKVIKNAAIDNYRKNRYFYSRVQPMDESSVLIPDCSVNVEEDIFGNHTTKLLNGLNETDRQIVILRCSNELPWREVAAELSLNESTVRKRFERVRKRIKGGNV